LGAVTFAFRAELRNRWRSWLAIALLIGIVGGFVLFATAAGRRTNNAYPQFVDKYGYDATVFATQALPQLLKLPTVSSATAMVSPSNGQPSCDCTHPINIASSNFAVLAQPPNGKSLWKLVSGQEPDQSAPNQILASFSLQRDYGVKVGTVIHVPFYTPAQALAANSITGTPPQPLGPTVTFRVVGIVASEFDFPSGQTPSYELFTTSAFTRAVIPQTATGVEYAVRLRHGAADLARFNAEANKLEGAGLEGVGNNDGLVDSVEASIHPQGVGWFILAVLAALVGLAVVGQALARQSIGESEGYVTLSALGASRRQLVMLGTARNILVGLIGAVAAVVLAIALSPLAPVGEARLAEPYTGIFFDTFVLLLGALAIAVVIVVLGIWPSVRAARTSRRDDRAVGMHPSVVVTRLATIGVPPSALMGVRNALQRRGSGANVPIGTAYLGTVLAVAVLCGTAVFGASLSHLTATPSLYGDAYQLSFDVIPGLPDPGLLKSIEQNGNISGITRVVATQVSIDHTTVGTLAVEALRGPLLFSTVGGRLPSGDGQIGLGAATMRQVDAHVGSVVRVVVTTLSGDKRAFPFRVVSNIPIPVMDGFAGLGNGAVIPLSGYEAAVCHSAVGQAACRKSVEESSIGSILAKGVSGPRGQAAITYFFDSDQSVAVLPVAPTSLINFGEAVDFPLIFGGIVAVFGAATLAHLLVVSVSRRRRETGLLKVLGFVNSQVIWAVSWQATTLALVGIIVGVPIGLIVGRVTWDLFASNLGVVPVSVVPAWAIGALAVGAIVFANLLAVGPALTATRSKPRLLIEAS
jgi:FtsX-like permease family